MWWAWGGIQRSLELGEPQAGAEQSHCQGLAGVAALGGGEQGRPGRWEAEGSQEAWSLPAEMT